MSTTANRTPIPARFRDESMVRFWLIQCLCLVFCGLITKVEARESPEAADEAYFLDELPVVLSATRLSQQQHEAPAAITIIDRAMIRASGVVDIADLMRLVPGFQVAHADGHTQAVTYHGLSDQFARRMQVLVDGRSVFNPAIGDVDWSDIPLAIEDIERIEVIRGPNGAAYGSNALLGAVNIITRHAGQGGGTQADVAVGDKDLHRVVLRHAGSVRDLDYRVTMGYRADDGFDGRHDSKQLSVLTLRGDYRLSVDDTLELQLGYVGGPHETDLGSNDFALTVRDQNVDSHFQQLRWRHTGDPGDETSVHFYHNYRSVRDVNYTPLLSDLLSAAMGSPVPPAAIPIFFPGQMDQPLLIDFGTTEQRFDLELQQNAQHNPALRSVWGLGGRLDRVTGRTWFGRPDTIDTRLLRVFGALEWRAHARWLVNAGAMIEDSSLVDTHISPRIALIHALNDNHGLRAGWSRGVRIPAVYEAKADTGLRFADNSLLRQTTFSNGVDAETIRSVELGYSGRFPSRQIELNTKIFHDRINDRIAGIKDCGFPQPFLLVSDECDDRAEVYANSGHVQINGAELELRWRPSQSSMAAFTYSYAKAKGTAVNRINRPTAPLELENLADDVPVHTRSVFLMHRFAGGIDASAMYYRVSTMKWLGFGDRLGPQERLDLRLAKNLRLGASEASIALVMQNLLADYLEFRDLNTFDTRAFVQLHVAFP